MYTDLTNKLNTGIKSRFTGFNTVNEIEAPAAKETSVSWVGSAFKSLVRAFDRLGAYPAVGESLFGMQAYLAGDLPASVKIREARILASRSVMTTGVDKEAKAYGHYDYFDFLADHGHLGTAAAQGEIAAATPARAALKSAA